MLSCQAVSKVCTVLILSLALHAADTSYLGTWKIDSAVLAPWADGAHADDAAEMKSLVGKIVAMKPGEIAGPRQVACKGPKYSIKNYPADLLFQGEFEEMHSKDPSADPAKLAAKLGFRGSQWKTLETGCANELDFHFIDPNTAAFGLNNYVYMLKKQ
jgi:hypothetical protein